MRTGKGRKSKNGGKELWHFPIYPDGTQWQHLLPHVDLHAVLAISQRKNLLHVVPHAALVISRKKSLLHVVPHVEPVINNPSAG